MCACVYTWYFKNSIVNLSLATNLFFFFPFQKNEALPGLAGHKISAHFFMFSFPKNEAWCRFGDEHRGSNTAPSYVNPHTREHFASASSGYMGI